MTTMLVLMILAGMWATVAIRWALHRRHDVRPGNSVMSFREQLSTLERATPGHSLRISHTGPVPVVKAELRAPSAAKRRRDVLFGLAGATAFFLLLAVAVGGMAKVLFVLSSLALGGYVYLLVQMRKRAEERRAKVRVLRPYAAPAPRLSLRTTASN